MEYELPIQIQVTSESARLFLRETKNLPLWTRFYKRYLGSTGSVAEMETVLGTSKTRIFESVNEVINLTIHSEFLQRHEKALIKIVPRDGECEVIFYLTIPDSHNQEHHYKMCENLKNELLLLKQYLESTHV